MSISKGIVVCRSHIVNISNDGVYTMSDGCGVDFIFRYCNAEMATVEGVPVEEMLNRSFYKVFPNGDKKWLVSYADVALNGTKHTLHDYSPEIDKNLIIHCYQPEPGYCACVLQVTDQSSQYFLTVFKKVKSSILLSYSSQSKQYITLDLLPLDALLY